MNMDRIFLPAATPIGHYTRDKIIGIIGRILDLIDRYEFLRESAAKSFERESCARQSAETAVAEYSRPVSKNSTVGDYYFAFSNCCAVTNILACTKELRDFVGIIRADFFKFIFRNFDDRVRCVIAASLGFNHGFVSVENQPTMKSISADLDVDTDSDVN
ncbi:MAG: hypothetical protein JSS82_00080 [Bacteroidetes bacterium]|nr:hypothetical protein [Bacteroidota bacterium]